MNERESNIIYIRFYLGDEQIAYISISKIDFVSDLINKFALAVDWKKEDLNNYKFIYSGKSLEPSLSVYESGLLHNSIIYLKRKKQIIGGYSPY